MKVVGKMGLKVPTHKAQAFTPGKLRTRKCGLTGRERKRICEIAGDLADRLDSGFRIHRTKALSVARWGLQPVVAHQPREESSSRPSL